MKTEIEAKWLDIDPVAFRRRLPQAGAQLLHPEILMRRKNFDFPDDRLQKIGGWVRVRDEGKKITLAYKQLNNRSLHGTKEASVTVDDFDQVCTVLTDVGLIQKSYQETKREWWQLGRAEITIDTWPWIPTFVEIEAPDEKTLRSSAETLGLDMKMALHGSVEIAYQKYYDFSEEEIDNWPSITFQPAPRWLLAKKRP